MKAQINIKADKTEYKIEVIEGYEIKDELKNRGYNYINKAIVDLNTPNAPIVSGWQKTVTNINDAKTEMAWLQSVNIPVKQGAIYK